MEISAPRPDAGAAPLPAGSRETTMSAPKPRRAAFAAAAVALLPLAACESPGGKVTVLQSSSIMVAPRSSYAWAATDPAVNSAPHVDNEVMRQRLKTAVDTALATKGYRQVADPAAAQLLVAYHVGLQDRSEAHGPGSGPPLCGMNDCVWGVFRAPATSAMVLDLTDRASGQLAWRATSETRVRQTDATQADLNAIVMDMTRTLPGG
jgi:hypothetical protein